MSLRLLLNENIPFEAVKALQAEGHDVVWIRIAAPGISDESVLAKALADERILVTFDKDFGELAFRYGLPAACGIILLRIDIKSPDVSARFIADVITNRQDWCGHFAVIEQERIRMTPLPVIRGS